MEATDRYIIYLVPISLLLVNAGLSWAYVHHIKTLRDAVRTWDAITPAATAAERSSRRSTLQTNSVRSSGLTSPSSPPPPYYEQQQPLNPSAPPSEVTVQYGDQGPIIDHHHLKP